MSIEVKMPSGQGIINLLRTPSASSVAVPHMEATAGAMDLDVAGQCPKCKMQMGTALVLSETVYYCDSCRVSLPLSSEE